MKRVAVDIWSDVVCPFCYIGKRRLEHAAKESNIALDITWHSFELDPNAPERNAKSETEHLSRKYGRTEAQAIAMQQDVEKLAAGEGITYNWAKSKSGNSFNAHRIIHLAQTKGLGDAAEEAFFKAYMTDGLAVGERPTVEDIAVRTIGLDAAEVKSVLDSNKFADAVRSDESRARNELRLSGVPYFLFEGGAASLSGAQSREAFARALKQVAANKKVTPVSDNAGVPLCTGDSCKLPK